ncbi:MAG: hypothetical protein AB8B74_06850 [Crocinitomicaceae bacterium]
MRVSVNGLGNIGTTLALVLIKYKQHLGISEVFGYKNNQVDWQKTDLLFLKTAGVTIVSSKQTTLAEHLKTVDFVFDTTSNGFGLGNKTVYESLSHLKGAIAQGSENGFGVQFMSGMPIDLSEEQYVQIVSCNTHAAASILNLFGGSHRLNNIKEADFVVVRRSEDLGNHQRLVTANVVARHLSDETGTHHALDVKSMYAQLNIHCPITSSDITTPSQLLHATRFHIQTNLPIDWDQINKMADTNPLIATTSKFDSNTIFELGRRYGDFGRIYNHIILVDNNILKTKFSAKGWAFVPQEGNTIISTITAFLKMTQPNKASEMIKLIQNNLCHNAW